MNPAQADLVHELIVDTHAPGAQAEALAALPGTPQAPGRERLALWTPEYGPLNRLMSLWQLPGDAPDALAHGADPDATGIDWLDGGRRAYRLRPRRALRHDLLAAPLLELRLYAARPGRVEDFVQALLGALPFRERYSPCAGLWTTRERGWDLAAHLWAYDSLHHRMQARDRAMRDADWSAYRAGIRPMLQYLQALLLVPVAAAPAASAPGSPA